MLNNFIRTLTDSVKTSQELIKQLEVFKENHTTCEEQISALKRSNEELKVELSESHEKENSALNTYQKQMESLNK